MDLINVNEVAELANVVRQRVWEWRKKPDFPKPVHQSGKQSLWRRKDIERWLIKYDASLHPHRINQRGIKLPRESRR